MIYLIIFLKIFFRRFTAHRQFGVLVLIGLVMSVSLSFIVLLTTLDYQTFYKELQVHFYKHILSFLHYDLYTVYNSVSPDSL